MGILKKCAPLELVIRFVVMLFLAFFDKVFGPKTFCLGLSNWAPILPRFSGTYYT